MKQAFATSSKQTQHTLSARLRGLMDRLRPSSRAQAAIAANRGAAAAPAPSARRDVMPQSYLDPAALARLGFTPLLARRVVEGFISGLHKSPFHGFSVEFADHREYVPGDDLKFLDWALYARTDHYYIKRFEEETNVRCHLLLDRSNSMSFGTGALTKWDYACFLGSCLAYLMLKQQDATGMALLGDTPGIIVPPRGRQSHLRQIMQTMMHNPPQGSTNLAAALHAMARNIKRRSMIVLISDLIDEPEETLRAVRVLASRRHDVLVFHIHDGAELDFTFDGATLFHDLETGEELELDPGSVRKNYLENLHQLHAFYRKGLTEMGVDYQIVDTREPYDHALSAYLRKRAMIRR